MATDLELAFDHLIHPETGVPLHTLLVSRRYRSLVDPKEPAVKDYCEMVAQLEFTIDLSYQYRRISP